MLCEFSNLLPLDWCGGLVSKCALWLGAPKGVLTLADMYD